MNKNLKILKMQTLLSLSLTLGGIISLLGCKSPTVVIDEQRDVVRLGGNVSGNVYVFKAGAWTLVGKTKLPEGWYAGPGPQQLVNTNK